MIKMFGVYWAQPYYTWLIPLICIMAGVLIYKVRKTARICTLLAGKWIDLVIKNYSYPKLIVKVILMIAGLAFLVMALCRPQWTKQEQVIAQEGRDVLIALDISRSMLATDCSPDRLTVAKEKIKKLLSFLDCERVGLILFSGSSFVQCPLTNDYSAFYMYLDHVDVETISSGSTALDAAIKQALEVCEAVPSKKTKLLVVFTDGEDFSSNLKQYKQQARDCNLRIFTVGVGTLEGAPIPLYNERGKQIGHQKDKKGNVVISQLNEDVLSSLARDAGGTYIAVTPDSQDMKQVVSMIQRFEKEKFEDKKISHFEDRYNYFILSSFLCFGAEWLL